MFSSLIRKSRGDTQNAELMDTGTCILRRSHLGSEELSFFFF